jgi:hypothetical protein
MEKYGQKNLKKKHSMIAHVTKFKQRQVDMILP